MKNVLILSYYFPPMGMGGVQRTSKFVKYLHEFGWKPVVITDTPNVYFAWDDKLLKELTDKGTIIERTGRTPDSGISEKKSFRFKDESSRKFVSRIAQTFLIPDTKRLWRNKALSLAKKLIANNEFDLIYATAPPYTDLVAGATLKRKYNIPLVLDYRDSWVDCPNNFYPTWFHKKLNMKLETRVLCDADAVITINEKIKELILRRYSTFIDEKKIVIIPQGFDPEDFENVNYDAVAVNKMRITYSGSFLYYYTPEYFLRAFARACETNKEMYDNVEACFIGTFPEKYEILIEELGLKNCVNIAGYVDHVTCIKYLQSSDVLWMMINKTDSSDMHSTGKLYEYFGAKKPILACIPDGVARRSLADHGAAFIEEPDDIVGISCALLNLYDRYKKDMLPKPKEDYIELYNRRNLTMQLSELFDSVLK